MSNTSLILPIVLLVLAFRLWRTGGTERPISMARLVILPAIFVVLAAPSLFSQPFPTDMPTIDGLAVAFVLGCIAGWFRGRTTQISVDAETRGLKARSTPVGLALIAGIVLIRMLARDYLTTHAAEWDISPIAILDGFMLFALGLVIAWRAEMLLRCRRLLREAGESSAA